MRDEKDPGTLEMSLPRKRGRPAKHASGAMTPAARAREYRYRRRWDSSCIGDMSDASLIDSIRHAKRVVQGGDADFQDVLDVYIEELVRRHHSSHMDLWDYRKNK